MGANSETNGGSVKTCTKTFEILEVLADQNHGTVSDIADNLDFAKSTVYRHLSTLRDIGYVVREDGQFYPSLRFLELGDAARRRCRGLAFAREKAFELSRTVDERVWLLTDEQMSGVYLYKAGGDVAPIVGRGRQNESGGSQEDPVDRYSPLHVTASGKCILAQWSREKVDTYIEKKGLSECTENTITSRDELNDELNSIRKKGYSVNDEEYVEGLRAVAAPVFNQNDRLLGGIAIVAPKMRLPTKKIENKFSNIVRNKAEEIELDLTIAVSSNA
jgi:IclR family KDG regulon transcriptional repressor